MTGPIAYLVLMPLLSILQIYRHSASDSVASQMIRLGTYFLLALLLWRGSNSTRFFLAVAGVLIGVVRILGFFVGSYGTLGVPFALFGTIGALLAGVALLHPTVRIYCKEK